MVKLFFGLPGCGKTTILTKFAKDALTKKRLKKKYAHVFSNVYLGRGGCFDDIIYINHTDLGVYDIRDGLVLIDEATLAFDSRDYKNFSKAMISFFLLHRHYNVDIILFTQQWDGVDRKIRVITDRVYYVYKGFFTGSWISKYYRIPYGIIIPDKKQGGEKLGDIVQGYSKPNVIQRIFCCRVFRPLYYRYFDSWEAPPLPPLPQGYSLNDAITLEASEVKEDLSGFIDSAEGAAHEVSEADACSLSA